MVPGPETRLGLVLPGRSPAHPPRRRAWGRDVPRSVSKACSLRYSMMKWASKRHRGSRSLVTRKGHRRSVVCRP
jgi:hypothetical protein